MTKTFTILHTNDMHSAFVGMEPAADYTPFTLNDDKTRGGYARLGALIAPRRTRGRGPGGKPGTPNCQNRNDHSSADSSMVCVLVDPMPWPAS